MIEKLESRKLLKKNDLKKSYLYNKMLLYIFETDGGKKVGHTSSDTVDSRIKCLQTGNVNPIKVLKIYKVKNSAKMEGIVHYFLREYRIRGEFFNCSLNFINDIINECIKLEERTDILDENLKIKRILLENFKVGETKDFVKLKDVKLIQKNSGIKEKDIITLKYIVEETFDGVEFFDRKQIDVNRHKSIFSNLKII